jgi:hypothetical protein
MRWKNLGACLLGAVAAIGILAATAVPSQAQDKKL